MNSPAVLSVVILFVMTSAISGFAYNRRAEQQDRTDGCRVGERFFEYGQIWKMGRCNTMQCFPNRTGEFGPINPACTPRNVWEDCVPFGRFYRSKCSQYVCGKDRYGYLKLLPTDKGCVARNGRCVKDGVSWTHRCITYTCHDGDIVYSGGCAKPDRRPGCVQQGDYYRPDGCTTYMCQEINNHYGMVVVRAECQSVDGSCRPIGSIFPMMLRGRRHERCTCKADYSGAISYNCFD